MEKPLKVIQDQFSVINDVQLGVKIQWWEKYNRIFSNHQKKLNDYE